MYVLYLLYKGSIDRTYSPDCTNCQLCLSIKTYYYYYYYYYCCYNSTVYITKSIRLFLGHDLYLTRFLSTNLIKKAVSYYN
jgi:hypothetical protein